jgi:hypothetical protein
MPIAALCRHSTQQAGEIRAAGRRCQMRVSQFAFLFVAFGASDRNAAVFHRIACARGTATLRVYISRVFGLENAELPICGGNASRGAALVTPGSYRDGALASFVDQNVAVHVQRHRLLRVSELRRQVGDRHPLAQFQARVAMA